jgi:predicted DCC family thiol-disulfide oxidoreductase YuxK
VRSPRFESFRVASPPARPLVLFDGDCGFCRFWIARWRGLLEGRVDFAPFQDEANRFPEVPREAFARAVRLVEPDGRVSGGAEAVFRALSRRPGGARWLRAYRGLPGFAPVAEIVYRAIAAHRGAAGWLTARLWRPDPSRPEARYVRALFLRGLAVIYFTAFVSLGVQIDGLLGRDGILPANEFLSFVGARAGPERFFWIPSLCWLSASNGLLHVLCWGGAALAVVLFLDLAPSACLFLLWAFYLSLVSIGQDFLAFQWDSLLLEAGLLAIFVAPLRLRRASGSDPPPSRLVVFLFRWLLFRLVFSSGVVKLASGDPSWRNLTALRFHYETQPLPTWIGYLAGQMPAGVQRVSTFAVLAVELAVPFLFFGSRRVRTIAFAILTAFQVSIAATGNYAFFNPLTVVIALFLLDDRTLLRIPRRRRRAATASLRKTHDWPVGIRVAVAAIVLLVSLPQMASLFAPRLAWPRPLVSLARNAAPLRSVNTYGLFAVMTTTRPEIRVEGSRDGFVWKAYDFRWKPGALNGRPRFVEPYQPRLDWQMWFAALGSYRDNPWFLSFLRKLLEGSPPVLRLLKTNPFPGSPPRYVRAVVSDYRFTRLNTLFSTGDWWRRGPIRVYCPAVSLSSFSAVRSPGAAVPGTPASSAAAIASAVQSRSPRPRASPERSRSRTRLASGMGTRASEAAARRRLTSLSPSSNRKPAGETRFSATMRP